ncbi:transmembrane protein 26-like [Cololabis saira]|uniref:transmembrane protein 26-like n=1 Tax=Cololabis saira TaxID=129043 RepID=UPI002AD389C4|nr:transmembrane protein 26-like [Cololabis saira]
MFFRVIFSVVTRLLFLLVSFIGVIRVVKVKNDGRFWFLLFLLLPLVLEMIVSLRTKRRCGCRWFSPAIFMFLISFIPTIWILELHHQENQSTEAKCNKLNSTESYGNVLKQLINSTLDNRILKDPLTSVCPNDWILALHQVLIVLLIVGKWLLPAGGNLTRDQLSQLLLIFVGTGADILEFTTETLTDIGESSPVMVYIILVVWTWSMLQFPLNLSVMDGSTGDLSDPTSHLSFHRSDLWSSVESLFIQDGPFLVVRLTVMTCFSVVHQMLIFFTIKNALVVVLNIYRLFILFCDGKPPPQPQDQDLTLTPIPNPNTNPPEHLLTLHSLL